MGDILKELLAVENACAEAFNQSKLEKFLAHFTDDVTGFSATEHDRFKGKEELGHTFKHYLSEADEVHYEIMDPEAFEFGEIAILDFYWRVTLKQGNRRSEIPGRGSHVFHKENGEWKIVHEHFSKAQ